MVKRSVVSSSYVTSSLKKKFSAENYKNFNQTHHLLATVLIFYTTVVIITKVNERKE